jgi:heat shock protein HtpX
MTAYEHIKSNNWKTAGLIALLPISFLAIIWFCVWIAGLITKQPDAAMFAWVNTIGVAIPTTIACLIWMLISWLFGDKMMLSSSGAYELSDTDPEYKMIYKSVENVALAAGLPTPRVYIIDDDSLNAFATGRNPAEASVALTRGIINKLSRLELEGVIAHEMAHIGNRDIRTDMLMITGVGVTVFAADLILRFIFHPGAIHSGGDNDNNNSRGAVIAVLLAVYVGLLIFNWLIVPLLRMAVSRTREYSADATGALITRNPKALADALRKISCDSRVESMDGKKSMAVACIEEPGPKEFASSLFATHPSTESRITRLENM